MINTVIRGVGMYLPNKILTNNDISEFVETSHEWIYERTGIKQRHIAAEDEMTSDLAYQAADFIISRSGASVISELCIVGKPVIFIPSPNVAENHQLKNAQAIAKKQAAILIQEKDIKTSLKKQINNLNSSSDLRNKLSKNIKKLAKVNATTLIADEIKNILNL